MSLVEALILGIVQGLTEFLPISSTAHLRIVPALLGWDDPGAAYTAIIQIGTTLAVIVYFAKELWAIIKAVLQGLADRKPLGTQEARLGWYIVAGTVPVVVLGLALKNQIEGSFRSLEVIAGALIGLALLLTLAERIASHKRTLDHLTLKDSLLIGLAQAVALIPGSSRSGVTLTGGLFLGFKRDDAARFSFLLAVPSTLGAGIFEMRHIFKHGEAAGLSAGPLIVGTVAAFVFGYLSIAGLLRFLRTRTTLIFIVYRLALGVAILMLLRYGILQA